MYAQSTKPDVQAVMDGYLDEFIREYLMQTGMATRKD